MVTRARTLAFRFDSLPCVYLLAGDSGLRLQQKPASLGNQIADFERLYQVRYVVIVQEAADLGFHNRGKREHQMLFQAGTVFGDPAVNIWRIPSIRHLAVDDYSVE